jgi:hypothetical protein
VKLPADGIYRMKQFPGLWIHGEALLANNAAQLLAILEQGLATAEHAAFVAHLAATQTGPKKGKKKRPSSG